MTIARTCPTCRSPIPADAPGGACPRCLMALAFATDAGAMTPDVAPADVARRFPGFEVTDTIGRGGMGVVFRARQKALDREVALKVLPGGPSRPAGFTERFEREAKALARLQHPGIVQVFDFGTSSDGWCFLAMELVDGVNLRRALADGRLAPKEALAIVPQICDALQYAHDHGVVHRDIKPENLLLTKDGRVKVADFGLAKLVEGAAALTHTGHAMGTPMYMAPEQVERPADVDHRADIYSLGVVFYEMLTGELPIGRFAVPSKKADVDARIDDIVLKTLEKERDARFQRAAEVKTRIDEAAASPTPPAPPASPRAAWRSFVFGPPAADGARVSRLAIAAALFPIAAGAATWIAWTIDASPKMIERVPQTNTTADLSMFAGVLLALVAWIRIRLSRGRLQHGMLCLVALAGSVTAPLVVQSSTSGSYVARQQYLNELNPALYPGVGGRPMRPSGPPQPRIVDGVEIAPGWPEDRVAEAVHGPAIRELIGRAQSIWPVSTREGRDALYDANDAAFVAALPDGERRAAQGLLGPALATEEFLGHPFSEFKVQSVEVDWGRTRATATLAAGDDEIRVQLARGGSGTLAAYPWRFVLAPVQRTKRSTATVPPDPNTPESPR